METSEPKTWELHVPINCCDGCKKKVERKLSSIKGVHDVTLNPEISKVIVTGNVSRETLIKNLKKISKQAKPWPRQRAEYSATKPAITEEKKEEPDDGAMRELSVSSMAGTLAAKGLSCAVGFLGQQTQEGKKENTCFKLSPEGGPSNGTKISLGLEFNLLGVAGKISYQKDVSFK